MSVDINSFAPDFTLKDSEGNDVSLSDFKGKPVLILFFPLAFSGVCTKELCFVRDHLSSFNQLSINILAISVDSFFTLAEFKKQQHLSFSLVSDFNKEVSQEYGAYYNEFFGMHGVSKRSAFVVNAEGKVIYVEILDKASEMPNFEAIQDIINKL
ncbi:MAG TPA: peroxiredoxin [Bacteroidetes bacterium]|nr:peroxiredoxin [Bacteroidota bacterium]